MKKLIIILLSVLAITFTFSGCGGSEGSISSGTDGAVAPTTPDTETPVVNEPVNEEGVESFDALGSIQESVGSLPGSPSGIPGSES